MSGPQLVVPPEGFHNGHLKEARERIEKSRSYADCSTIMVVPAIKPIPPKVVQSWLGLMAPMNQKFTRLCLENMEVGDAYNAAVEFILGNPELSTWQYMLTVETDNIVPPDALLKLIEDIESGPYDAVGALYWTKGEGGQPMCYGNPKVMPRNFVPWLPETDTVAQKMLELAELQKQGKFKPQRKHDVLSTTIGSKEHRGRVPVLEACPLS